MARAEWSWNCKCGDYAFWYLTKAEAEAIGAKHVASRKRDVGQHSITARKDRGPKSLEDMFRL